MARKHPSILWAQRSKDLFLSIEVEDINVKELVMDGDKFILKGDHGSDQYDVELTFYDKVKGDERRQTASKRRLEFSIPKEKAEWWPRLLKEKTKIPWIKVDFDKWKDEDEEKDEDQFEFGNMDFSNFGMPGGGMGMSPTGMNDLGDLDDNEEDMEELEDAEETDEPDKDVGKKEEKDDSKP